MRLQGREKGKIRTVGQIQENLPPELPLFAKLLYFGQFGIGQARMAVHRRLCYPHVTSAAVVYGGRLRRKILLYLPTVLIFPFLPTLQSHILMRLSSVPRSPL